MSQSYLEQEVTSAIENILTPISNGKKPVILAVDDEQDNLSLIRRTLRTDYEVLSASNGSEALQIVEEKGDEIALIISDQRMPEMEGLDLFKKVSEEYPDIVKILLTGYSNIDILVDAINECHLFQYVLKPFEPEQLCLIIQRGIQKYEITTSKSQVLQDLSELFYKTIKSIAQALDAKDKYTHGHSMRVTLYALALAEKLNIPEAVLEEIETTGLLHDIGKIAIPDKILLKPGKLTDEEFAVIKSHPQLGENLIKSINKLGVISKWLKSHHEKYDGTGYPEGLKGDEIPLSARIIAIADTYDAMTSNRSYRCALTHEEAISEIQRCSGTQFDPELAKIFYDIRDEIKQIREKPDYYYPIYSYLDKYMNVNDGSEIEAINSVQSAYKE